MRRKFTMRIDPEVLNAARRKAARDNRTLANYIETLIRRDVQADAATPLLEVIAPPGIRNWVAVPIPGETAAERKRRDALFLAVLDASGH